MTRGSATAIIVEFSGASIVASATVARMPRSDKAPEHTLAGMVTTDAASRVKSRLDELVREGTELGVQVAAYVDGELVLDVWAGVADEATGRPVDGETLFTVFSATKGV